MEVIDTKEPRETTEPDEEDEEDEVEERDEEEAEEELDDVEGLLLARFFDRLADGLAARTNSTPSAVNRYSLPMSSS
jgi:TATA-binding protein-associated factor Taf7